MSTYLWTRCVPSQVQDSSQKDKPLSLMKSVVLKCQVFPIYCIITVSTLIYLRHILIRTFLLLPGEKEKATADNSSERETDSHKCCWQTA